MNSHLDYLDLLGREADGLRRDRSLPLAVLQQKLDTLSTEAHHVYEYIDGYDPDLHRKAGDILARIDAPIKKAV